MTVTPKLSAAARKPAAAKGAKPAATEPPAPGKAKPLARPAAAPAAPNAGQAAKPEGQPASGAAGNNPPRPGSKRAQVVALIARPNGASADEIKAAFKADEWTDRHVRECVAILRRAHGVPVVAREDGRLVIGKPGEVVAKPGKAAAGPAAKDDGPKAETPAAPATPAKA